MHYLLSVDAGTTSTKVALFDTEGHLLASAIREYTLLAREGAIVELEAETYWTACADGIREVLARTRTPGDRIAAVCVCSQGESFITLGRDGEPLRPAIVWLDNRAVEEARIIEAEFGADRFFHVTGVNQIVPGWTACKVLWLRRHEPEIFERTACFLLVEDYLLYRLSGQFASETSVTNSTGYQDLVAHAWWDDMLRFLGLSADRLPRLHAPGTAIGGVLPSVARELGLSPGTAVVTGAMDQMAGAVGAGNVRPGIVTETTGTALAIVATLDHAVFDRERRFPCMAHVLPDTYALVPYCQTSGMVLKWFRDHFAQHEVMQARAEGRDPYEMLTALAAGVAPGSEGLVMLPHLAGAFSPEYDPHARGVYFGISLHHGRAHFVRAIMEAVAFMLRNNLELLRSVGTTVSEVRSLGGAARSDLWMQIKADTVQMPLVTLQCEEAAALGLAVLGGTAVGIFPSVPEACARISSVRQRIEPRQENFAVYERNFRTYRALYESLRRLFSEAD